MKLYAPEYYKKFKCIADKCKHSCCIGWEIDIDSDTLEKYAAVHRGYGKQIADSISLSDTPHFVLRENQKCPHLNNEGLCNIISNLGEDYLCDICREHPRFYNNTTHGMEVGLGLSCEEACRIVLSDDDYDSFFVLEEIDQKPLNCNFDAVKARNEIYKLLSDKSSEYQKRIQNISRSHSIDLTATSQNEWAETIASLEYLDNSHKELFLNFSPNAVAPPEIELFCERFLAYLIYRHCSPASDENEYRAALFFSLFCEKLLVSAVESSKDHSFQNVVNLSRIISEEIEYSEDNTETIKSVYYFNI